MPYKDLDRDKINARRRALYAEDSSRARQSTQKWRLANPEKVKVSQREKRLEILEELVTAYGGACECCGEDTLMFMTIDHIFNDGAKHQRSLGLIGKAGIHIYRELKRLGFPKDRYRLLCYNCNCGRARNGGICPHER